MADVTSTLTSWSSTAASNLPANSAAVGPNTLADNQRTIQAVVRAALAGDGTIASATTTDLSTVNDGDITVSGTTTITGFGTLTAGIKKILTFSGALTLTHNATSLILPGAANITTAAGDVAIMRSLGSGNWKCISFTRAASLPTTSADIQVQLATAFTTGGTSTAYTGAPSPAITSNTAKQRFNATFHLAPGASPTLAVSGQTALPLKYYDAMGTLQAITASQFGANFVGDVVSDGTSWIVLNAPGVPAKSVKGTSANDSAAAGYVGEYIESFAGPISAPAANTFGDITSITLTAGDWDISAMAISILNTGVSITSVICGIGTVSGTSGSGLTGGDTQGYSAPPTSNYLPSITIPPKRVSLAATTTYYLKMWMSYSSGTPQFQGRISARRVR